jgi:hypothetical protein
MSSKENSSSLDDLSRWWERVDDVEGLEEAEILIRDKLDGRESRGICGAFERTKGSPRGEWEQLRPSDSSAPRHSIKGGHAGSLGRQPTGRRDLSPLGEVSERARRGRGKNGMTYQLACCERFVGWL